MSEFTYNIIMETVKALKFTLFSKFACYVHLLEINVQLLEIMFTHKKQNKTLTKTT